MNNVIPFLKTIAPAVTPIAAVVIAAFAAAIAFFQWRTNRLQARTNQLQAETNREKLRLDLYNRRFEIYLRCLDLYEAIGQKDVEKYKKLMDPFIRAHREARFLFPTSSSVYDLITDFSVPAGEAMRLVKTIRTVGANLNPEFREWCEKEKQAMERVRPFIPELEKKLAPFLNFHDL